MIERSFEPAHQLECDEFVGRHGEFLDGELDAREWAAFEEHAAACASCARYDRVVRRGLLLVRNAAVVEPSAAFYERLQQRLADADAEARRPIVADTRTAVLVAAVLAIVALAPLLPVLAGQNKAPVNPVATPVASPVPVFALEPAGGAGLEALTPRPFASAGPHSPLVVQAPLVASRPASPLLVSYPTAHNNPR